LQCVNNFLCWLNILLLNAFSNFHQNYQEIWRRAAFINCNNFVRAELNILLRSTEKWNVLTHIYNLHNTWLNDKTWNQMALYCMIRHNIWHHMTLREITWHFMTWANVATQIRNNGTLNDTKCRTYRNVSHITPHDVMCHTWRHMIWHDIKSHNRIIRVKTRIVYILAAKLSYLLCRLQSTLKPTKSVQKKEKCLTFSNVTYILNIVEI
jgi:hypothetical protein